MVSYLEMEHRKQTPGHVPSRCARIEVSVKGAVGNDLFELMVNLDLNRVMKKQHMKGKHSYIDAAYMKEVEAACLANEEVKEQIHALDLPTGSSVVVEPWAYATDGMNTMDQRISMVLIISSPTVQH